MKRFKPLLLWAMLAIPFSQALAAGFAGQYGGVVDGTPTTVTLQQSGDRVSGVMDASGYRYELNGRLQGRIVKGQLRDTRTNGSLDMEVRLEGSTLTVTMLADNPNTGQRVPVPMSFTRGAKPSRASAGAGPVDARLVGTWRKSQSYVSGDFSVASEVMLQLRADGTYSHGNGRTVGGGSAGSFDSGTGDVTHGRWKAQNRIIYNYDAGSGQWHPYARYGFDESGGTMMFTFDNNSRELWQRVR